MRDAIPQTIYLKDYQVPEFLIDKTSLVFDLNDEYCRVSSELSIRRNPSSKSTSAPLILDTSTMCLLGEAINPLWINCCRALIKKVEIDIISTLDTQPLKCTKMRVNKSTALESANPHYYTYNIEMHNIAS